MTVELPVPLHHSTQPEPYGCLYHAAFAILGDETLLADKRDANPNRFAARLAMRGILRRTLFNDLWQGETELNFWERLRGRLKPGGFIPLIVYIKSRAELADHHAVAVVFSESGQAWVSDSKRPEILAFTRTAFLVSRYSSAQEVTQLLPRELDLFSYEDAVQIMAGGLPHDPG